ncbi:MAG: DUF4260 family protein [Chloroflexota bacterium]
MILDFSQACFPILKGWHDLPKNNDTPLGLVKHRTRIYNPYTPSEFLLGHSSLDRVFGYGLKHKDAFQNTHLGRIGNQDAFRSSQT